MKSPSGLAKRRREIVFPILSISWHGGTRVLIQIANYLATIGYKVTFLVSRNRCNTPFEFAEGVSVRHVGVYTGLKAIDYSIFILAVPFSVRANSLLIASFFVTYYPVRVIAAVARLPYLYFVQDIESKYPLPRGLVLNALCKWTYRDRRIVTANPHLRDRLLKEFGTQSRTVAVGPAAVFYALPPQSQKQYDVIYFLRREPWKGLDRFLRFLEVGRGRLKCICVSQDASLQQTISGRGPEFRKPLNDAELIKCIDSARVLLLTSYHEGFSLPPLEAMARGVPTVLFRCGGPELYIENRANAVYVASEEEAVEVIEKLVGEPLDYERMREQAIVTAGKYRMDASLSQIADYVANCDQW